MRLQDAYADPLAHDESPYDTDASDDGPFELTYVVPVEGAWIDANYEELESLYLAMKDYINQYALPFLGNSDYGDFCKAIYKLSR